MGLLDIGVSGLQTSQAALRVTGNNISNADVQGYSRQRAEVATRNETFTGAGFLGNGASVTSIDRIVDQFIVGQVVRDTSAYNELEIFSNNINQIDSLLANADSGLGPGINELFGAIEVGAQDPTSIPARQLVLSNAEGLVERFRTLHDRIVQQNSSINEQLNALTDEINALADGIAKLNVAIQEESARGSGVSPNQLLDEQEELLRQLSELVNIQTSREPSGRVNVFVGNGQTLVIGAVSNTLGTQASGREPGTSEIVYVGENSSSQQITDLISGGQIGGLLDFRDSVIDLTLNSLGRIAIGLGEAINSQNQKGVDIEGNLGGLIFSDINSAALAESRVIPDTNNNGSVGTGDIAATISDINQLTTSDYVLSFSGAGALDYQVLRTEDNTVFTGTLAGFGNTISVDGVDIDINAGAPSAGDIFYIRPTRSGADDIQLDISRPQELAYAAPIVTGTSVGNIGTGEITPGEVINVVDNSGSILPEFATPGRLSPPIEIRFGSTVDANGNSTRYDVINSATGATISTNNFFTPGDSNEITIGSPGAYRFEIAGAPRPGDTFSVGYNTGISDSRNALALGQLRINGELDTGSLNFENAYGRLVERIGARTAQTTISRDAAESLLIQTQATRDSVSGVNLDEEAANLIKFEQTYNAAAQIINVARQLFDTLLSIF